MNKILLSIVLSFFINSISAETGPVSEETDLTTISRIQSAHDLDEGDVIFRVANPADHCFGYWIRKTDPLFTASLSIILAAYQAKTTVKVTGDSENKWKHSRNLWCKLISIKYPEPE